MSPKINLRARIERHSRVLQHNLYATGKKTGKPGLAFVSAIAVFMLPIYPSFANFVSNGASNELYREEIDESTIISSFELGENDTLGDGNVFIQSKDSYLYVNAVIDDENRDVSGTKEVIEYTVKGGDSFASIAQNFNITRNSILWANNFDANHMLRPGDVIKVPPVSGLIHKVQSGETLSGLASKYKVDSEEIMRQNLLLSANDLKIGDTVIIPGAIKEEPPKPKVEVPAKSKGGSGKKNPTPAKSSGNSGYSFAAAESEYVSSGGSYKLSWRKPQHTFYWGNCTWYVAQYKNVNWGGNANQWLANARAAGHSTGSNPTAGAIIAFNGRGYNPYYGHVGIVTEVTDSHLIISDMNYRALGEVTTRKIPRNDRSIQGFIYVD